MSLSEPSLAETEAGYVPASPKPGAGGMFLLPVVGFVGLTVRNVGPAAFVNVSASPSGSEPVTAWSAVAPSATVMSAIALSVGARFTFVTVIWKDFVSLRE